MEKPIWKEEFDQQFTYLAEWIAPERRSDMLMPEKASKAKAFISSLLERVIEDYIPAHEEMSTEELKQQLRIKLGLNN